MKPADLPTTYAALTPWCAAGNRPDSPSTGAGPADLRDSVTLPRAWEVRGRRGLDRPVRDRLHQNGDRGRWLFLHGVPTNRPSGRTSRPMSRASARPSPRCWAWARAPSPTRWKADPRENDLWYWRNDVDYIER
jgi:hypothetical protein